MDEEEADSLDYSSPVGQLIKTIEIKSKKPEIDNSLSKILDEFKAITDNQEKYLQNGIFNVNFSEGALLLQSSATYYGKRVDKLWDELLELHTRLVRYDQSHAKEKRDSNPHAKEARQAEIRKLEERVNRHKRKKISLEIPQAEAQKTYTFADARRDLFENEDNDDDEENEKEVPFEEDKELLQRWAAMDHPAEKQVSKVVWEHAIQPYRLSNYEITGDDDAIYDMEDEEEFNSRYSRAPSYHHIKHLFEYNDRCLLPDTDHLIADLRLDYIHAKKFMKEKKITHDTPYDDYKEEYEAFAKAYHEKERRKIQNMPQRTPQELLNFYALLMKREKEAISLRARQRKMGVTGPVVITLKSLIEAPLSDDILAVIDNEDAVKMLLMEQDDIELDSDSDKESASLLAKQHHVSNFDLDKQRGLGHPELNKENAEIHKTEALHSDSKPPILTRENEDEKLKDESQSKLYVDLEKLPNDLVDTKIRSDSGFFEFDDDDNHSDTVMTISSDSQPLEGGKPEETNVQENDPKDGNNSEMPVGQENGQKDGNDSEMPVVRENSLKEGNVSEIPVIQENAQKDVNNSEIPVIQENAQKDVNNSEIPVIQENAQKDVNNSEIPVVQENVQKDVNSDVPVVQENAQKHANIKEIPDLNVAEKVTNHENTKKVLNENQDIINNGLCGGDVTIIPKQRIIKEREQKVKETVKRKIEQNDEASIPKRRKLSQKQIEKLEKSLIDPVKELKWEHFFSMSYQPEVGEGTVQEVDYQSDPEDLPEPDNNSDHAYATPPIPDNSDNPTNQDVTTPPPPNIPDIQPNDDSIMVPPPPNDVDSHSVHSDHDYAVATNQMDETGYHSDHEGSHVSDHDYCLPESAVEDVVPDAENNTAENIVRRIENEWDEMIREQMSTPLVEKRKEPAPLTEAEKAKARMEEERRKARKRVDEWKAYITPKLKQLKENDFDIHEYGSKIIDSMEVNETKSFSDFADGKSSAEVVRYFISSLQLANTYNVEICGGKKGELANDSFGLKLLNKERYHEHLNDYQAPSEETFRDRLARVKEANKKQQLDSTPRKPTIVSSRGKRTYAHHRKQAESHSTQQPKNAGPPLKTMKIVLTPVSPSKSSQSTCSNYSTLTPDYQQPSASRQADLLNYQTPSTSRQSTSCERSERPCSFDSDSDIDFPDSGIVSDFTGSQTQVVLSPTFEDIFQDDLFLSQESSKKQLYSTPNVRTHF